MGTGVSPKRIATRNMCVKLWLHMEMLKHVLKIYFHKHVLIFSCIYTVAVSEDSFIRAVCKCAAKIDNSTVKQPLLFLLERR